MFMDNLASGMLLLVLLFVPLTLVVLDFIFFLWKRERPFFEVIAFFIGSIYMAIGYWLWDLPDYTVPINTLGTANVHEPISGEHLPAVILFAFWGFGSYYLLKFFRKSLPPMVEVILLGGVYVGCGISIAFMIQLLGGARPKGWHMGTIDVIEILCLASVPAIFLCHAGHLMVKLVKERAQKQESIQYENLILRKINLWFLKGANLFWAAAIALLPVLGVLMIILCLFGQQPDSIILAFTKTSDWILSGEAAPPAVSYDEHYLCTVSLRGHKRLVRPIRFGIRKGEKIVVNRQLCVANAFEQLIMERTPRFHKAVRCFYDTYGYPLSRHIKNPWSADITYLLMKPLEWVFLIVLYLFDEKPENRICSQYLPKEAFLNFFSCNTCQSA